MGQGPLDEPAVAKANAQACLKRCYHVLWQMTHTRHRELSRDELQNHRYLPVLNR